MSALLVLTNCPNAACAESIAKALVESKLAACVNILSPCQSIYRWQGALETASEIPLLIKTTSRCYPALQTLLASLHPYAVPEIIALPITAGWPDYLHWLAAETQER